MFVSLKSDFCIVDSRKGSLMRLVQASARIPGRRITLALASVVLLVTGCHVPGTGASGASSTGSQTITVAVVSGARNAPLSLANAPLRLAVKDGLFRQRGSISRRPAP